DVGIYVRLAEHRLGLAHGRPPAVHDHETGAAERRVVERRLQQFPRGDARHVEPAESLEHVEVDRETEAAGLAGERAEEIVLERLGFVPRGCPAADTAGVYRPRERDVGIAEIERPEVSRLELYGDRAALPLAAQRCDGRRSALG